MFNLYNFNGNTVILFTLLRRLVAGDCRLAAGSTPSITGLSGFPRSTISYLVELMPESLSTAITSTLNTSNDQFLPVCANKYDTCTGTLRSA